MEIHSAARKHGVEDVSIRHAFDRALVVADLDDDYAPHRQLLLGPDVAGNMLELIVLQFDDGREFVIHAMPLRRRYRYLLPRPDGPTT